MGVAESGAARLGQVIAVDQGALRAQSALDRRHRSGTGVGILGRATPHAWPVAKAVPITRSEAPAIWLLHAVIHSRVFAEGEILGNPGWEPDRPGGDRWPYVYPCRIDVWVPLVKDGPRTGDFASKKALVGSRGAPRVPLDPDEYEVCFASARSQPPAIQTSVQALQLGHSIRTRRFTYSPFSPGSQGCSLLHGGLTSLLGLDGVVVEFSGVLGASVLVLVLVFSE
jgi:hypothetical protein